MQVILAMTGVLLVHYLCGCVHAQTPSALPPAVDEVLQELKKQEAILFGADGFICRAQRVKCEDITPSRYSGGYFDVEFVVARKGDQWRTQKAFINTDTEIQEDSTGGKIYLPKAPNTSVMKDGLIFEWLEAKDVATVDPFGEGRNMHLPMDYFRHIGFDASKHLAHSARADYSKIRKVESAQDYLGHPFLPDYLQENKSKYSVLPQQEAVDGAACWVLKYPGMDKVWLDPERGYAVRRRIYHWGPGKPRKYEIVNADFKEYLSGLWLPQRQIVEKYASILSEDKSIWDMPCCRLHYELVGMTFGDIPDALFNPKVTPGMTIHDGVRGIQYCVAAEDQDPFEGPIAAALNVDRTKRIVMFVVGVVVLLISVVVWRLRERQKA